MNLDKATLENQLAAFRSNSDEINRGITSRVQQIEELKNQIEQHRGALSYNLLLIQGIEGQLKTIADEAAKATTS